MRSRDSMSWSPKGRDSSERELFGRVGSLSIRRRMRMKLLRFCLVSACRHTDPYRAWSARMDAQKLKKQQRFFGFNSHSY